MQHNQAALIDFIEAARKLEASDLESMIQRREEEDKALRSLLMAARQREHTERHVADSAY